MLKLHRLIVCLLLLLLAACTAPAKVPPTVTISVPPNFATESHLLVQTSAPAQLNALAPDFTFTQMDGTVRKLSDLRGQRVLLNFWASWCMPCRAEMPALDQARQHYADQGVTILAINRNELPETVARFITEQKIGLQAIVNTSGDIGDAYGVTGLPISVFINRDGTIGFKQVGAMDESLITERIEALQ